MVSFEPYASRGKHQLGPFNTTGLESFCFGDLHYNIVRLLVRCSCLISKVIAFAAMRLTGEFHIKGRYATCRGTPDSPVMGYNDGSSDCQTEASVTWVALTPCWIDPIETMEKFVQMLWFDRPAGILDAKNDRLFRLTNRYRDVFPGRGIAQRIG